MRTTAMHTIMPDEEIGDVAQAFGLTLDQFIKRAYIIRPVIYWQFTLFGKTVKFRHHQKVRIFAAGQIVLVS